MTDIRKPRVQDDEPPRAAREREHVSRVDELADERATHRERPVAPWIRPSSLAAPDPRPGMVQRWIRVSVRGEEDPRNVNMRSREGWTPRPIDTVPEDFIFAASRGALKGGHFVVDDLMLCEMPKEIYEQRATYYQQLSERQMQAVETDLDRAQSGQPISIQRSHKSSATTPGRRVEAADD